MAPPNAIPAQIRQKNRGLSILCARALFVKKKPEEFVIKT
ncbi:protein of unknown function [Methylacidimicrobium sp. AP8]|nr:protein of unknown function [Methylacidimicrobium sp. AP8]